MSDGRQINNIEKKKGKEMKRKHNRQGHETKKSQRELYASKTRRILCST